jgi:hypothetical protein
MTEIRGFEKKEPKQGRVYGAANIQRAVARNMKAIDHSEKAAGSLADKPHKGTREQERRRRQAERAKK